MFSKAGFTLRKTSYSRQKQVIRNPKTLYLSPKTGFYKKQYIDNQSVGHDHETKQTPKGVVAVSNDCMLYINMSSSVQLFYTNLV